MSIKLDQACINRLSVNVTETPNVNYDFYVNGTAAVSSTFNLASQTASAAVVTDASKNLSTRAILNNTSVSALNWNSNGGNTHADNLRFMTVNTLAYWNGAYSGTTSNLEYYKGGKFGTMAKETAADYAKLASPVLTGTPAAPTAADGTNTTQIATTAFVMSQFKYNDAMIYKGVVNANSDLPTTHYQGWTYRVATAGTYAGIVCEIGDMIICNTDGTSANNAHWNVIQTNIDGAVIGPAAVSSGRDNHVPRFDGETGKLLQSSGVIIDDNNNVTIPGAALRITNTSGAKYILLGNQDSSGANCPVILQAANGGLFIGNGTDWSSTTGGTLNTALFMAKDRKIGIGTTSPSEELHVNGTIKGSALGKDGYVAYPLDGAYDGNGTITGYIKIKIPETKSMTMFSFDVDIYNYVENTTTRYHMAGYNYNDASWNCCTAYCIAPLANTQANLTVRFLSNGNDEMYVTIGETDTYWCYPKVVIHNIAIAHSNCTLEKWKSGWTVTTSNAAFDDSQIKATITNTNIAYKTQINTATPTSSGTIGYIGITPATSGSQTLIAQDSLYIWDSVNNNSIINTYLCIGKNNSIKGGITLSAGNSYYGELIPSTLTSSRTYTLPDATGTIALTATTLSGYGITDAVRYAGNITSIGSGSPASGAKTWWKDTTNVPKLKVVVAYNNSGSEKTMIFSKGNADATYGTILQWGYADKYLRILRKNNSNADTWYNDDWEKIDAGYADSAGTATTASSVSRATFGDSSNGEHNANNINSNGLWYYSSNGPASTLGAQSTDGAIYSQAYSTSWVGQIAQDYRDGQLFVRGKNNNSWQSWYAIPKFTTSTGGVGESTTPVYIDTSGNLVTCTSYANASVSSATNATNASKISATLDATHKTYLLGTQSTINATAANVSLTGDSYVYLTATEGDISAVRHTWNVSGTDKAYTTYNTTDDSIDFVFI